MGTMPLAALMPAPPIPMEMSAVVDMKSKVPGMPVSEAKYNLAQSLRMKVRRSGVSEMSTPPMRNLTAAPASQAFSLEQFTGMDGRALSVGNYAVKPPVVYTVMFIPGEPHSCYCVTVDPPYIPENMPWNTGASPPVSQGVSTVRAPLDSSYPPARRIPSTPRYAQVDGVRSEVWKQTNYTTLARGTPSPPPPPAPSLRWSPHHSPLNARALGVAERQLLRCIRRVRWRARARVVVDRQRAVRYDARDKGILEL